MRFTKMHGIGNDYIYLDLFALGDIPESSLPELARRMSDRHFGVGSDGLVTIGPADGYDCRMRMFNLDGSEGNMCGNAIRCIALYMAKRRGFAGDRLRVLTRSGERIVQILRDEAGKAISFRADMGEPIFAAKDIPVRCDDPAHLRLHALGQDFELFCVSMGNPHAVTVVDDPALSPVCTAGPLLEKDPIFPAQANIEFIAVRPDGSLSMRVWERGSGETLACGTGACAAAVAALQKGLVPQAPLCVHLRGGDLLIHWDRESNHVFMEGPAAFIFDGEWPDI